MLNYGPHWYCNHDSKTEPLWHRVDNVFIGLFTILPSTLFTINLINLQTSWILFFIPITNTHITNPLISWRQQPSWISALPRILTHVIRHPTCFHLCLIINSFIWSKQSLWEVIFEETDNTCSLIKFEGLHGCYNILLVSPFSIEFDTIFI